MAHDGSNKRKGQQRTIFVIMPFVSDGQRDRDQLDSYFRQIRTAIEGSNDLRHNYAVRRSSTGINITEQIIKDLYFSDIVIADLSGNPPNPNVMYELGLRLAFSHEPVLLVRAHDSGDTFDVRNLYTFAYDPFDYAKLHNHLLDKLRQWEEDLASYSSPVLDTIGAALPIHLAYTREYALRQLWVLYNGLANTADLLIARIASACIALGILDEDKSEDRDFVFSFIQNEDLQALDWSLLKFDAGAVPGVYDLVGGRYLFGLVENDVEEALHRVLFRYYMYYGTAQPPINKEYRGRWYAALIHDTIVAKEMTHAMTALLAAEDRAGRDTVLKAFFEGAHKIDDLYFGDTPLSGIKTLEAEEEAAPEDGATVP